MEANIAWLIASMVISSLLGLAATITSSLVLFNLRSMNKRIETMEANQKELFDRKIICQQEFVDKVTFIRSVTALESSMKTLLQSVSNIQGSMKAIEQMPAICGSIAREILKESRENQS